MSLVPAIDTLTIIEVGLKEHVLSLKYGLIHE